MRIVIATGNPHKVDEIRAVLAPMGFTVVALPELLATLRAGQRERAHDVDHEAAQRSARVRF